LTSGTKIDLEKANLKTVDFPTLDLSWPVVKEFESRADAIRYFKLANTQYSRALKKYPLDGYVTEFVRIQQCLSRCYKALGSIETEKVKALAMINKRISILRPLADDLNPATYLVF
jgi:hypothetical protein